MKLLNYSLLEQVVQTYSTMFKQAKNSVSESDFNELEGVYNDLVSRFNPFLVATGKIPTPPEPTYTFVTVPLSQVSITVTPNIDNAFTIDWGDGSEIENTGVVSRDKYGRAQEKTFTHTYSETGIHNINMLPVDPDNEECVGDIDFATDDSQFTEVNLENLSWQITGNDTITKMTINSYIEMFGCGNAILNGCSALTELKIGNKVQNVMFEPINECLALRKVTIDSNENFVMLFLASYECQITEIHCLSTTPFSLYDSTEEIPGNPTSGTDTANLVIYVPASAVDTYKAADVWSDYAQYIQAEV